MNVTILGTGYVGLTTAVTLAYLGHRVVSLDVDEEKIRLLESGRSPIYEPFLEELMREARNNLRFTTDYPTAIRGADVVFITVGTPSSADGSPDLRYVQAAARGIGQHLGPDGFTVVVNKSTVPIGSGNWVESLVRDGLPPEMKALNGKRFAVASNPEFLREGSALADSLYADRVVVGSDNPRAIEQLRALYRPILEQTFAAPSYLPRPASVGAVPLITTDVCSAELVKYSANAFLSLKISFINEIAELAERVGADVTQVAKGIGLDARIGPGFLSAGLGWGGSCFGKDTAALISTGKEYGLPMTITKAAREVNLRQRERTVNKLLSELKIIKGRTIALLGLAFKPHTDDLRDAPALDIAQRLLELGARVRAHDPIALERAHKECKLAVDLTDTVEATLEDTDAVVLVTEWPQYRTLDWIALGKTMRNRIIVDGRNFLDRGTLVDAGFRFYAMGR